MSNFHILDQADDQRTVNVIIHVAIPSTNNAVGVNYQAALVKYLGGSTNITSIVATTAEISQMKAGALFEWSTDYRFSRLGLSNAQKLAEISSYYNSTASSLLDIAQVRLNYYGYNSTP